MHSQAELLKQIDLGGRLTVVSNRLPFAIKLKEGDWTIAPGSGGLVTALTPLLNSQGGLWIGWSGTVESEDAPLDELFSSIRSEMGHDIKAVPLNQEELEGFYRGFSNQVLWPLFHDLLGRCNFDPDFWEIYLQSNRRFAATCQENVLSDDFLWVHDYHLVPLGSMLRDDGFEGRVGFYLHIPFPSLDIYSRMPWRRQFLEYFLAYNVVGFQTHRDFLNFIEAVRALLPEANVVLNPRHAIIFFRGRQVWCQDFPISIDFHEFDDMAKTKEVMDEAWIVHEQYPNRKIYLGVDRLDYTKGITYRFEAFRRALRKYPELIQKIVLVQLVVPSRVEVNEYQELKGQLDTLVGEIMGEFSRPGWVPIHYFFRPLKRYELIALYRAAEAMVVTPIRDGMNLVAKEYVASQQDNGVLLLSEFAGAARELARGAVLVNPYDQEGLADAMYQAFIMGEDDRRQRMEHMRRQVSNSTVYKWVTDFLNAALASQRIGMEAPK